MSPPSPSRPGTRSSNEPPSASGSDSESDLDLTLDELLGPTESIPLGRHAALGSDHRYSGGLNTRPQRRRLSDSATRIALRRLGLGHLGNKPAEDDEHRLLEERDGRRSSHDPARDEDETPLLNTRGTKRPSRRSSRTSLRSTARALSPALSVVSEVATDGTLERIISLNPAHTKAKSRAPYPANIISNHRYNAWTFLPLTLYNEFKYFFNLYFLLVALSQIIPALRIGYLSTYIVPLVFVLSITLGKEAFDDVARRKRDTEANSEAYQVLCLDAPLENAGARRLRQKQRAAADYTSLVADMENITTKTVKSKDIKVGDVLVLKKDKRVPADVVILKSMSNDSSEPDVTGETFIRTDQLDGETDWKLRVSPGLSQTLSVEDFASISITASAPSKDVHNFLGTVGIDKFSHNPSGSTSSLLTADTSQPLNIDNTAWANTVIASNSTIFAAVIFTGPQTRQALSTSKARSKTGLLEEEINSLSKILCLITLLLSIVLVVLREIDQKNHKPVPGVPVKGDGAENRWWIKIMRFLILFSSIIPISLRVNLDMGKTVYARFIEKDEGIKGTVVRTSTIPEELGRVEYLLSDKTGTLTQNDMELKKIHVGTVSYAGDAMDEVQSYVRQTFGASTNSSDPSAMDHAPATRQRREIGSRVRDLVVALSICHNVTPTTSTEPGGKAETSYQASSPDEIAIVKWVETVGLRLVHRDRKSMKVQSTETGEIVLQAKILDIFPFTSEGKRMGIIVQLNESKAEREPSDLLGELDDPSGSGENEGEIWFFQKGADTVMSEIVAANDWLDEETGNMAREGLRTLVVGRKQLSAQKYAEFSGKYKASSLLLQHREREMGKVVSNFLEKDLELLGITGVEDKLQRDVKPSLELLRNAGIKIWMLTGDKVETARCVAISAKLVARGQYIHTVAKMKRPELAQSSLEFLRNKPDSCLLIDGESLALFLDSFRDEFIALAVKLPAVVACRCSPTQKADIARLIRAYTNKRICCIGDGGNDVSMIQAADVGVGIVGKEGRQASLAADFSITQFCHLTKLLVWHGRNSYKRSAKLAQFVIHRGLIISVAQTVFSVASRFEPIALYQGWLLVGYASLYTMFPVFSLVLDRDVDEDLANLYPELYKELTEGKSLSYRTFAVWLLVSIYQGGVLQGLTQTFVPPSFFQKMVSVGFTALILNELVMVALEITTWHPYMWLAELGTAVVFFGSFPLLGDYFDLEFVVSGGWVWRVLAVLAASVLPIWVGRVIRRWVRPPSYAKVQDF